MKNFAKILLAVALSVIMIVPTFAQAKKKITIWCTDKEVAGFEPLKKQFKKEINKCLDAANVNLFWQLTAKAKFLLADAC